MDEINGQLAQMRAALELASEEDKPGIQLIIDQLEELLGISSQVTGSVNQGGEEEEDEYKLFQAEIAALGSSDEPSETGDVPKADKSIGDELEALIGMKCMAPHQENWGQIGYYSAMISSVLSLNNDEDKSEPSEISDIMVRVMFLQPVVKSQLLCPFYKEDRCRFEDSQCKFSHGEVVPLAQLREYSEPDYSAIVPGSRVLAKYHDDLWYKATVQRITEDGECEISYDVGNEALTVPLHETSPIQDKSDDLSSSEDDVENPNLSSSDSEDDQVPKSLLDSHGLLDMKGGSALGEWEKFTKGVGSKLMLKMGYVMGTGLGRNREGRVEPVDAIVLPPGKSLDACMELKERAKDGNLFSAEKQRQRRQRREAKQREKQAAHDKRKEKEQTSMFNFLNEKLALRKNTSSNAVTQAELRKQSSISLNKRALGLDDSLRQVRKDIQKTKESMERQKGRDKETFSILEKKLGDLEGQRRNIEKMQANLQNEQRQRSDKKKLDLF